INTEIFRILGVKCVFCIDESGNTAFFLCCSDCMKGHRRLTGGFRTIDFDDSAFWISTDSKCVVQGDGPAVYCGNFTACLITKLHDCTFTKLLLHVLYHCFNRFLSLVHNYPPLFLFGLYYITYKNKKRTYIRFQVPFSAICSHLCHFCALCILIDGLLLYFAAKLIFPYLQGIPPCLCRSIPPRTGL